MGKKVTRFDILISKTTWSRKPNTNYLERPLQVLDAKIKLNFRRSSITARKTQPEMRLVLRKRFFGNGSSREVRLSDIRYPIPPQCKFPEKTKSHKKCHSSTLKSFFPF
jgi:hypothetical protein